MSLELICKCYKDLLKFFSESKDRGIDEVYDKTLEISTSFEVSSEQISDFIRIAEENYFRFFELDRNDISLMEEEENKFSYLRGKQDVLTLLGLYISSLIQSSYENEFYLDLRMPLNLLAYKLNNKGLVISGDVGFGLGMYAKDSEILVLGDTEDCAGDSAINLVLNIEGKAGNYLAFSSEDCVVYAKHAGCYAGARAKNLVMILERAENFVAENSIDSLFILENADHALGLKSRNVFIHVKNVGHALGALSKDSVIYVSGSIGKNSLFGAKNTRIVNVRDT